jgi:hypothetical protein
MSVKCVVALRGDFDARFPDLRGASPNEDRVPGRDLAECVLDGLRRRQIETAGPFYEEPFFALRCQVAGRKVEVLCYIYEPAAGTWVVEAVRTTGLLARLRGRTDLAEVSTVVGAVHETLLQERRVLETRWFLKLPATPFGNVPFSTSPFGD